MSTICSNRRRSTAMNKISRFGAVAVAALGCVVAPAFAQCVEEQKLTASDAAEHDHLGGSVSVSGDIAVVGGGFDDCAAGVNCGSAYVYGFNGTFWVEEQKLTASDRASIDWFGTSVSVSGGTAIVGAERKDCAAGHDCGAVYVFRFNGTSWVEEQKLTASDAASGDVFGWSVSVSGDTAVVGASRVDCAAGVSCGAAYVFRFNGASWVEEQKLTASEAASFDFFGDSVSVSGDTAIVGASGAVYVFRLNGTFWVEEQKLTASDAAWHDHLGGSVSVSGDMAVLGAPQVDCAPILDCGAAYVFRFNGISWIEEQKLTASDAGGKDRFGRSVSVSRDAVVVGAGGVDCAAGGDCGAAYVFRFNGTSWIEAQKLTASDAALQGSFGGSVSMSGDTVVVGAAGADCAAGYGCGAAYVFSCVSAGTVVNLDIKPGSCPNPVNPKSKGVLPVAVVGSYDFDVATVDLDSLTLARTDGVGGSVSPLAGRRGGGIVIKDAATPLGEEPCACHELGGDGIDDLTLKFSTSELSRALELIALPKGETIELVLRGTLQDGTTFEAVDCIKIPGTHRESHRPPREHKSK